MTTRIVPSVGVSWPDGDADAGQEVTVPDEVATELLRRGKAVLADGEAKPKAPRKRTGVKSKPAASEE